MVYYIKILRRHNGAAYYRYVTDHNTSWDGGCTTPDRVEAKVWKTRGGAERWIRDRPELHERENNAYFAEVCITTRYVTRKSKIQLRP